MNSKIITQFPKLLLSLFEPHEVKILVLLILVYSCMAMISVATMVVAANWMQHLRMNFEELYVALACGVKN